MPTVLEEFRARLHDEWLPSFCNAPHRNHPLDGFDDSNLRSLSELDAHWFLRSLSLGIVAEAGGFFTAPQSKVREQLFWTGSKTTNPRRLTLWLEPIVTIGALARLHEVYGWPTSRLGCQSSDWAFDLVCYGDNGETIVAGEIKKTSREVDTLVAHMSVQSLDDADRPRPVRGSEKNAFMKVTGVRPQFFWALGPADSGGVYRVAREPVPPKFRLLPEAKDALHYRTAPAG
jgi:hypothetical protein